MSRTPLVLVLVLASGCPSQPEPDSSAPPDDPGEPTTVTLRWTPPDHESEAHVLGATDLQSLLPPESLDSTVLLELDLEPALRASLEATRVACGPGWETGDVTASCPATWGQAELNLFHLLGATAANTEVAGTSLAGLDEAASTLQGLGLADGVGDLLSELYTVAPTDPLLTPAALSRSWQENVVATHPQAATTGVLVTLGDALDEMSGFATRYDQDGTHPGFVDSTASTASVALLAEDFSVALTTTSNLHWHDGVRLSEGKAPVPLVDDLTGPTFDDLLEFDFDRPETFAVSGLVNAATVDLVLDIGESPQWIPVGTSVDPLPWGDGPAWQLEPWELERVVSAAAYTDHQALRAGCDLCTGAGSGALLWEALGIDQLELAVGRAGYDADVQDGIAEHFEWIDPNPAGWLRVWTLFGLGDPVAPQYAWDALSEILQRRLLDRGNAQGSATVRTTLAEVPVGLTAGQVEDALRPLLDARRPALSAYLLGDIDSASAGVDFYLVKPDDGKLYLYFAHPDDPVQATHATPGFFSDPSLKDKVSVTDDGGTGDAVHEKLSLGREQTVYCEDGSGTVYRLDLQVPDGDSLIVEITRPAPPARR